MMLSYFGSTSIRIFLMLIVFIVSPVLTNKLLGADENKSTGLKPPFLPTVQTHFP